MEEDVAKNGKEDWNTAINFSEKLKMTYRTTHRQRLASEISNTTKKKGLVNAQAVGSINVRIGSQTKLSNGKGKSKEVH